MKAGTAICMECSAGTFSTKVGATSVSTCVACPAQRAVGQSTCPKSTGSTGRVGNEDGISGNIGEATNDDNASAVDSVNRALIGGTVGGVIAMIGIAVAAIVIMRKLRKSAGAEKSSEIPTKV